MNSKWNTQIDNTMRQLYEVQKVGNWAQICERLNTIYGEPLRHPKQCRERYINAVKFKGSNDPWTQAQFEILRDQFLEIGPKWSVISKKIPARGQNAIKNKFNAELRKFMRKLNTLIKNLKMKHRKPICIEWFRKLTKVVFEQENVCPQKKSYAQKLIKQFIRVIFEEIVAEESAGQLYHQLLQNICSYNRNYLFSKIKGKVIFSSKNQQPFTGNSQKPSNETPEDQLFEQIDGHSVQEHPQYLQLAFQSVLSNQFQQIGEPSQLQHQIKINSPSAPALIRVILAPNYQIFDQPANEEFFDFLQLSN